MKTATSSTTAVISLSEAGLGLYTPPVGKPIYGVYFDEVISDLPLALLCVRELKLAGYTNERTESGTDMDTVGSVGIVNTAGFSTTAVVPGIPSKWLLGNAIYADAYAFYISLDNLHSALQSLTINETIIASLVQLAQKQCSDNGTNTVLICTLLEKAGSSMQEEIKIAVSRRTMNRYVKYHDDLYHHHHYYYCYCH